ncbi:MAG: transporter [Opitutaceae bacterium]|nr:transporter [Opitutaceae bacterium]
MHHLNATRLLAGASVLLLVTAGAANAQVTESPGTVEPGKVLVEMDAWSYSRDREGPELVTSTVWANTLVTTGVSPTLDLQLGAQARLEETYDAGEGEERVAGFGDVLLRAKWAFYQDEKSGFSAALLPFLKLPTNSGGVGNDHVEGGVILPVERTFPGGWYFGANAEVDLVRDGDDSGYALDLIGTAYAGKDITDRLFLYVEAIGYSPESGQDEAYAGAGAFVTVTEALSFDYEYLAGVNRAGADHAHTFRANWKF